MKNTPMKSTAKLPCKKLHVNRETLRMLGEQELQGVAAGAPTRGVACTFSEPSQCPTCLCTR
jgi:hypothetical protein